MEKLLCKVGISIGKQEWFWGSGVAELLIHIDELHSIRAASKEMYMSYSKALRILKKAENQLGFKLIETYHGGNDRGGAALTEEGRFFLTQYQKLQADIEAECRRKFECYFKPWLDKKDI